MCNIIFYSKRHRKEISYIEEPKKEQNLLCLAA
jgi:hypothetical protein